MVARMVIDDGDGIVTLTEGGEMANGFIFFVWRLA